MSGKDIVLEARDLVIRLGQDRKSAFCKAVTHKVIEAEAQNLINRLADEVERLRERFSVTCGNCGERYLGPRDDLLHGYNICNRSRCED